MPDLRPYIVVVDDDPGMNQAIERLVKAAGFRVLTFRSAEAFLETGRAEEADCLILDINLSGRSGLQLSRDLEALGSKQPVIFITAYDDCTSRAEAQQAGAIAFLTKPFAGHTLLAAINTALAQRA